MEHLADQQSNVTDKLHIVTPSDRTIYVASWNDAIFHYTDPKH